MTLILCASNRRAAAAAAGSDKTKNPNAKQGACSYVTVTVLGL